MVTHIFQPQETFVPVLPVYCLMWLDLSSLFSSEELVEKDQTTEEEGGVAEHSQILRRIIMICIPIFEQLSGPVSYMALSYLWEAKLGELRYISTLKRILVLQTCTGAALMITLMVRPVVAVLTAGLICVLDMYLKIFGSNPGGTGNEDSESIYLACPLTAPDSIRVIRLHPGSHNDELECTLAVFRLEEKTEYEALSYCWGQRASNRYIKCQSSLTLAVVTSDQESMKTLAITDTLHDALVFLRNPHKERILWVDQICIN